MRKDPKEEELAQQATFIFRGTVQRLKAATIPTVPVTDKTIVVRVDEILRAPEMLSHFAGDNITVQLGSRETVKKGEQATFYTNSWMVGESLAVQSVGHTTAATSAPRTLKRGIAAPTEDKTDRRLQEHVANADTVVTGKVMSVRVLDEPSSRAATTSGSFQPISEHHPVWQEAVIKVTDVEKGSDTPEQIVVRFPDSTDVQWYEAPKFQPGQEGVFLLQKEQTKKGKTTRAGALAPTARKGAGAQVFTALDSAAFQPLQKIETIRTLIKAAK